MCPAKTVYVHSSPARPCCSLWCKLCMCKKHSIIRPSIIRGCQWALSGWYITLSCPLPQLGPTQPARHVGNTAGKMYSTGQELGFERCSIWCAFLIRRMPYCICSPIWMMMNVVRRPGCPLQLKKSEYWTLLVVPTVSTVEVKTIELNLLQLQKSGIISTCGRVAVSSIMEMIFVTTPA